MPKFSFLPLPIIRRLCEFVTYTSLLFCFNAYADILVITRIDSDVNRVDKQQLSALWLKQSLYVNETAMEVIDLPEDHPARKLFYSKVVGKTGNKLSAYWAIQVFRGHATPPSVATTEQNAIEWIKTQKNRLAYVNAASIDENIKIIYRLVVSQDGHSDEN